MNTTNNKNKNKNHEREPLLPLLSSQASHLEDEKNTVKKA